MTMLKKLKQRNEELNIEKKSGSEFVNKDKVKHFIDRYNG